MTPFEVEVFINVYGEHHGHNTNGPWWETSSLEYRNAWIEQFKNVTLDTAMRIHKLGPYADVSTPYQPPPKPQRTIVVINHAK